MKNRNISTLLIITLVIILCIATYGINNFGTHNISKIVDNHKIESIVKDYLLKNPEVIIDSIKNLEVKNANDYMQNLQKNVLSKKELLEKVDKSPSIGPYNADNTIVQFYDYRCGYCKKFSSILLKLLNNNNNVKIIFREFPILGEKSNLAARAALAVNLSYPEKFWDFHNHLMETRGDISQETIKEISKKLNIPANKIFDQLEHKEITEILEQNKNIAREANIASTPTVIINGELILDPYNINNINKVLNNKN